LQCDRKEKLTIAFVQVGADFSYRESYNALMEVEWMRGDSEMMEEEFEEGRYRRDQLHPETEGRYFRARLFGAGHVHREGRLY
jgi:hypothetical protein